MSEKIVLDEEFSPILVSLGQYEFFMSHGKQGIDAMNVFIHLIYTARRQHTNQVWAAVNYLKKGLSMGNDRVKRAKAFLKQHGFISYVARKQETTGYNEKVYIQLNFIHTKKTVEKMQESTNRFENQTTWPTGLKSNRVEIQPGGNKTEMLKVNNRNASNEQYKTDYVSLVTLLIERMEENNSRVFKNKDKSKIVDKWYDPIRKLIELDEYTITEVRDVINWCQADEFWKTNILCTDKLRKQFSKLFLQMRGDKHKPTDNEAAYREAVI